MLKTNKALKRYIFIITFTFSCLTTHSDILNFYGGNNIPVLLKQLLIVLVVAIISFTSRNDESLICKYPPIIVNCTLFILIFDFYITNLSGTMPLYKIWWLSSIFVAEATLFLTITFSKVKYYEKFYYKFWKGFTPTFIFSYIFCFIRKPYSQTRTINFIPFNRSFKFLINFIKNPTGTFENPLYFFGNIIFFIPIPFILSCYFRKIKTKYMLLIGFLIPILIELYQYIFSCGDVDIDDLILNWIGYGIGVLIHKAIKKELLLK